MLGRHIEVLYPNILQAAGRSHTDLCYCAMPVASEGFLHSEEQEKVRRDHILAVGGGGRH